MEASPVCFDDALLSVNQTRTKSYGGFHPVHTNPVHAGDESRRSPKLSGDRFGWQCEYSLGKIRYGGEY